VPAHRGGPLMKSLRLSSRKLNRAILLFALPLSFSAPARAQGERCGVAKDLMVQALERIKTGAATEAADGLELLKHANQVCISLGDAWYYRSLFEHKLGQDGKANYSLSKARAFGSEAMNEGANPFVLAAPPATPSKGNPPLETKLRPVARKWALVIGISQFSNPELNLRYTSKDAKDFAALLLDPKYGRFQASNLHTLADSQVTTRRLKEELNWLARMAGEEDLVAIFLATHGTSRSQDTAEVNYLVTSDTDLQSEDSLFATALPMVELSDIVRTRVKARRTAIFLDTCHSAGAASQLRERATGLADYAPSRTALERIRQGVGRAILASSQEDQVSYEGPAYQNGYFTHFLLEALQQNNGMNTVEQVYSYIRDELPKAVSAQYQAQRSVRLKNEAAAPVKHATQIPVLSVSESGADIVLGVSSASN